MNGLIQTMPDERNMVDRVREYISRAYQMTPESWQRELRLTITDPLDWIRADRTPEENLNDWTTPCSLDQFLVRANRCTVCPSPEALGFIEAYHLYNRIERPNGVGVSV